MSRKIDVLKKIAAKAVEENWNHEYIRTLQDVIAKEAQEEIEAAAARAEAEVGDGWTTEDFLSEGDGEEGGQRPFFQVSSKGFSTVDKLLVDTVHELIIAFSKDGKGDEMSEEEREELFLGLVSVLTDEDVGSLASVLTEQGYGEHLLEALDAPDEFEDIITRL